MTRKEQIEQARLSHQNENHSLAICKDFIAGAEWADAHPHWISTDEMLPKRAEWVLVSVHGYVEEGRYMTYNDDDEWENADYEEIDTPEYWMPKPKSPDEVMSQ